MKNIIVDNRISGCIEHSLLRLGFNILKIPSHPSLPISTSSHPDTLFFRLGDTIFTYADYTEYALPVLSDLREYYRGLGFVFVSETPASVYPGDCGLNALRVGDKIYARTKSLARAVKERAAEEKTELKDVKQGYPACSVLKLTDKAAITSDRGMAKALSEDGIEVLLIREGYIELPPHEYGFIGGASFVHSDRVYFFGDLKSHPDNDKILAFIERHGLRAVSLGDGVLFDLGGALVFE